MRAANPRAGRFVGASYERTYSILDSRWQFDSLRHLCAARLFSNQNPSKRSRTCMPAMSDSTPKKPVIIVKPSVSDLWRLCKRSFKKKHLWWTFRRSVNSPKHCTSTTSARNISSRRGEETHFPKSVFERLGFTVLQSDSLSCRVKQKSNFWLASRQWALPNGTKTITAGVL